MKKKINLDIKGEEITSNFKFMVVPLILLVSTIGIFFAAYKIGLPKVITQRDQVNASKKERNILKQKESLLKQVGPQVSQQVKVLNTALPEKNPSLSIMSQLKNLAAFNMLFIENLRVGSNSQDKNFGTVNISFDINGERDLAYKFIEDIKKMAPLITVDRLSVSYIASSAKMTLRIKGYYAAYPEKLPALTDPITDLSNEEKELTTKMSQLTPPQTMEVNPAGQAGRTTPF